VDPIETFSQVESLYGQILDLTLRQEGCLAAGDLEPLGEIVTRKFELLDRAQALLAGLGPQLDRSDPSVQAGIQTLARVLAEVVASEDRCKALAPAPKPAPPPPPARAVAAYGRR